MEKDYQVSVHIGLQGKLEKEKPVLVELILLQKLQNILIM